MNYVNSAVRRQDRLLEVEDAMRLLNQGEYGFLSLGDEEVWYSCKLRL